MADERCAVCGAPAVWSYMPATALPRDRDYCEAHVPSRGCGCLADDGPDELGRLLPCCEYMWIGPDSPRAPTDDGNG